MKAHRTLASLVLCLCVTSARAQDGGAVLDAPLIEKSGNVYTFNKPAFDAVNEEMKRLQQVEREHKGEPAWSTPILVGLVVGAVVGAAIAVPLTVVLLKPGS